MYRTLPIFALIVLAMLVAGSSHAHAIATMVTIVNALNGR